MDENKLKELAIALYGCEFADYVPEEDEINECIEVMDLDYTFEDLKPIFAKYEGWSESNITDLIIKTIRAT